MKLWRLANQMGRRIYGALHKARERFWRRMFGILVPAGYWDLDLDIPDPFGWLEGEEPQEKAA